MRRIWLYGHVPCLGALLDRRLAPLCRRGARRGALARGLRPIVVGGTGLYLTALTEGLADIPAIPPEVRARSMALIAGGGVGAMLDDLAREDKMPFARIDRDNPIRRAARLGRAAGAQSAG